ncbi:thioredoxin-like protein [Polychaeton citri CBS 116435]|uniref:Thioredoxin-like protein n=1 Tax=Polychaeton citri CBS 116435 TaxID=1314669 RepID=A0A9P4Q852_9PEZI|nr:thioredoxin-like protein [Polychaeton citri CBS 116435]
MLELRCAYRNVCIELHTLREEFDELVRDKGRRVAHPEDDARSTSNRSEDDEDKSPVGNELDDDEDDPRPNLGPARNTIPTTRYGANTGPKGVISDAQNFRDSMRSHRQSMDSSRLYSSQFQQPTAPNALPPIRTVDGEDDDEGLDEDDNDDDDFMASWRQKRMRELQSSKSGGKAAAPSAHREGGMYGSLTTVDTDGYLDAVERSPASTTVIVYIYDDEAEASMVVEDCLRTLAQDHAATRFVRLHYQDAEMEPAGVPALLAYRGGDKFAGLVPVIDEMPDDADISAQTLEVLLKRHQILT